MTTQTELAFHRAMLDIDEQHVLSPEFRELFEDERRIAQRRLEVYRRERPN